MNRRMWTTSEIQTLREMRSKGISFLDISVAVNHSFNSCATQAKKYFISKGKTAESERKPRKPPEKRQPVTKLGNYDVKSEIIDRFLYSKALRSTSISDAIFQTES